MMSLRFLLCLSLLCPGLGPSLFAATKAEVAKHKQWMDSAQDVKDELLDAFDANSAAKVAETARKLESLGRQEQTFWEKEQVAAAARLAGENVAASNRLAAAAGAGRLQEAKVALGDLNRSCAACHDLHPEKQLRVK